jgi:hypothetical protein
MCAPWNATTLGVGMPLQLWVYGNVQLIVGNIVLQFNAKESMVCFDFKNKMELN